MTQTLSAQPRGVHPFAHYADRLLAGGTLLPDTPDNVIEVMGALDSYGVVLDCYSKNLIHIANHQFLVLFPVFKYFDGDMSPRKLWRHFYHDRINYEYAEYMVGAVWMRIWIRRSFGATVELRSQLELNSTRCCSCSIAPFQNF